jgi:VWFA-related protein
MRPSPFLILSVAVSVAAAVSARPSQAPGPPPSPATVVPAGVELVTVDVLVLDGRGRPVEGLRSEDFTIKEDGRVQAITSFEPVVVPESVPARTETRVSTNALPRPAVERTFVIVFDDANITQYATPHAREAVSRFLQQGLRPGDQVMIVPTAGGAWWSGRIPEDRDSLLAYVRRQEGRFRPDLGSARIADHEAMAIWMGRDPQVLSQVARRWFENNLIPEAYPVDREARAGLDVSPGLALIRSKAGEVYRAATGRLRLTLDTLGRVAESLGPLRGRKNLILVSEGFIMDPSQPEFREVVQAARRANAVVHFLDARGTEGALGQAGMSGGSAEVGRDVDARDVTTSQALAMQATSGARNVALDTGGSIVPSTAGLGDAMTKIAEESRAYYLVGYTSTNPRRDGSFRKIEVQVARPGTEVRARRGYYAPRDGERRKEDPDRLDPQVRAGLDSPLPTPGVPLRMASYVFGGDASGKTPVLLAAEADVAGLGMGPKDGRVAGVLDTYVVVHARDTGQVHRQESAVELNVPVEHWEQLWRSGVGIRKEFALPPGAYQARLLVRDRASGRLGTVRHAFEVPGGAPGLRTSTPILTDVFQSAGPNELPRPVPVAHRTFRPGVRLGYAYDIYGASPDPVAGGPKVSAGYVVRRAGEATAASPALRPLRASGLGRLGQVFVLSAPSEPGEYEFVLQVRDEAGARSLEVVDPFTVAP